MPVLRELQRRLTSSSSSRNVTLHWLDLRGSGLSMFERLSLEEALLRHDDRNWVLAGAHDPWPHKYLSPNNISLPNYIQGTPNPDCLIVMGIGGKPDQLLNIPKVQEDQVVVCKRFSGGGTVVLDPSSLWTTLIGRTQDFTNVEPFPKSIMQWSADVIFGPTFAHWNQGLSSVNQKTLVVDTKSCSATENRGVTVSVSKSLELPKFALRENDYVFGNLKMGGNAQSIVKGGWLHHTSFLWDFDSDNMEYLQLPNKRPDYRGDRSHEDFLAKLQPYYGNSGKNRFFESLLQACDESFHVEKVKLSEAMEVIDTQLGGMDAWWEQNRTRVVHDLEQ